MDKTIRQISILILGLLILAVLIGALGTWLVINELRTIEHTTTSLNRDYECFHENGKMYIYYYDRDITDISFYLTQYDVKLGLEDK